MKEQTERRRLKTSIQDKRAIKTIETIKKKNNCRKELMPN